MFLSDLSIKRPVLATILNLLFIVFGLFSFSKIAVENNPNIDFPIIIVSAAWPGADATLVEEKLLKVMEENLNGIEGLDSLIGTASPNSAFVVLQFKLGIETSTAMQNVLNQVGVIQGNPSYPSSSGARAPQIRRIQIGELPIATLVLSSEGSYPFGALSSFANDKLVSKFQQINGIGQVNIIGDREREIQVLLNKSTLQSIGLSPSLVANAIQSQIMEMQGGTLETNSNQIQIKTTGVPYSVDQIARIAIPVPGQSGNIIRVSDVAEVIDGLAFESTYGRYNDKSSIILLVNKQAGGNIVKSASEIKDKVAEINKTLPPNVSLKMIKDSSVFIKDSMSSVFLDMILGAILAVCIIYIFLRDWRATIISALALPTAIIGTFAAFTLFDFSINNMTLLGLTLSIGLLVDDAIVVIENIYRHIGMGKSALQAAKDGTAEIGLAAIAISLSVCAVFIPVAFMDGIVGRFFYPFGITVSVAVLISLFIAFTLTPMLSSRLLKKSHDFDPRKQPISAKFEVYFKATEHYYKKILTYCLFSLKRRLYTVLSGVIFLLLSFIMLAFVPKAFVPIDDINELSVVYQFSPDTPLSYTKEKAIKMSEQIRAYAGVKDVLLVIGSDIDKPSYKASLAVLLVKRDERKYGVQELVNRLRIDLNKSFSEKGSLIQVDMPNIGGRAQLIQLKLIGSDSEKLQAWSNHMKEFIETKVPDAVDTFIDPPPFYKQISIVPDAVRAADVGISANDIGQSINILFNKEGMKLGEMQDSLGNRNDVRIKINPKDSQKVEDISGLYIQNKNGMQIPLASVTDIKLNDSPSKITHSGGIPFVFVLANYIGKDLSNVNKMIAKEANSTKPDGFVFEFDGQGKFLGETISAMIFAVALSILLVFMTLCAQFESYIFPFVIMTCVPLAFSGAFGFLLITGKQMNLYAMIGLIMLIGLVVKSGILLIDFTLQRMRQGIDVNVALLEAGPLRLRPILMTTFAMIFGMLPIAFGHGAGGEGRSPMAICVIGGLISSTLLTLVIVPCVLSLIDEFQRKLKTKVSHKKVSATSAVSNQ
ncbi:efflux RND transporter permease subunit [Fluviispira multicolorata]|uniref:MMPL family transporter n=1 Tax=Fluviispira multicolorata TaxID=2654512 RepID=A0A833JBH7_9BACT|nr:efflux RND transporter permease subunit [Fluviispira multicolorata]KAB8029224.1 MMPL family transporter [Fluviispira multicolorata]